MLLRIKLTLFIVFFGLVGFAQTKISGVVRDKSNNPIPFANIVFKGSTVGTVSNENGAFYLESKETYTEINVSFLGFETKTVSVKIRDFDLIIQLEESASQLEEVVIHSGKKTKKKGNPAIDILKKLWEKKKQNGLYMFNQYEYEKYEKLEFDLNNIDSTTMKSNLFKGIEFIFEGLDTSSVTGKTFLPIFINESVYKTYGDNIRNKEREDILANVNSGFSDNESIVSFVKDLYMDYDIYKNYVKIFDKSFVSPISKPGVQSYNYILNDTAFIDNKWCYNIIYYPRRKNELTFKGDFWISDTTFAVKKINMQATKSANINWVKDIYIEQEFDVLNDSVFLLKRDYIMSDFALRKKNESKGIYGKRTTTYKDYQFDLEKPNNFYGYKIDLYDESIYNKGEEFWNTARHEKLNENEIGIYKMIDTLKTVPKFKAAYNLISILGSGYIEIGDFDFGPIYSTIGQNDVEGWRLRAGGRTYFSRNDPWRLQGYTAYGFKDQKFKFGVSGKFMFNTKNRFTLGVGTRYDIEQIGVSLTTTNDVLGRSFASSAIFATGDNGKLTEINLSNMFLSIEPVRNLSFRLGGSYRTLVSAAPDNFNLDYWVDRENNIKKSNVNQSEIDFSVQITPNRKTIGFGVERSDVTDNYATVLLNYSRGFKGMFESDFDYEKIQIYYRQPMLIGGLGRTFLTAEFGQTYGEVPLGLLNVVPGNQSYMLIENTYSLLDYYEFVTDKYASIHLDHSFNGRLFARVPLLRKLNLREFVGVKALWGSISDKNIELNASNIQYRAPENGYFEYSFGIGNIFKLLRIDFAYRGSYKNLPGARDFMVKFETGIYF